MTRVIHFGDFLVVRLVGGDVGGVLGVTVTIDRGHADLLFGIGAHQPVLGVHLHTHHRGVGLFATRHAHGHPAGDQGEVMAVRIKPRATAVRQNGRALEEQQAVGGGRRAQAPAAALFHEVLVIFVRLKAEQREAEPILAAAFAVATAAVTTGLGEDRHDFVGEIDRLHHAVFGHGNLHFALHAVDGGGNGRLPIAQRRHQAGWRHRHHIGRGHGVLGSARHIHVLAGVLGCRHQLLTGVFTFQVERLGAFTGLGRQLQRTGLGHGETHAGHHGHCQDPLFHNLF